MFTCSELLGWPGPSKALYIIPDRSPDEPASQTIRKRVRVSVCVYTCVCLDLSSQQLCEVTL